jgi:DNA-binding MarR family transcriptional regulator
MADNTANSVDSSRLGWELSTAVVLFYEAVANHLGLSAADHKALGLIMRAGALTAGDLAQVTGLSPGAVTGLIDRLEQAGFVRRQRDPADRRRVVVTVVHDQRPDLSEILAELAAAMNAVIAKYDERQVLAIHDYVVNTIAVLQEQTRRLSRADPAGGGPA